MGHPGSDSLIPQLEFANKRQRLVERRTRRLSYPEGPPQHLILFRAFLCKVCGHSHVFLRGHRITSGQGSCRINGVFPKVQDALCRTKKLNPDLQCCFVSSCKVFFFCEDDSPPKQRVGPRFSRTRVVQTRKRVDAGCALCQACPGNSDMLYICSPTWDCF